MRRGKHTGALALITRATSRARGSRAARDFKRKSPDDVLREEAKVYRSGMQRALLEARHRVSPSGYEAFFKDVSRLTAIEEQRFSSVSVAFDYMATMETPKSIPLQTELLWLSYRIAHYSGSIEKHLVERKKIQEQFLASKPELALQLLTGHEEKVGVSLWSMAMQIALRQWINGVSDQKDYANKIRHLFRGGMLPFLANFFSQRAEETVSIGWYIENTIRRVSRVKTSDIMKYVAFKALSQWPDRVNQFATILRMEQNHHEIDVYETTISALQEIVARHPKAVPDGVLQEVVGRISHLPDCRIEKLAVALNARQDLSPSSDFDGGLGELVQGRPVASYRAARRAQRTHASILATAVVGLALSDLPLRNRPVDARRRDTLRWVAEGLSGIFSKRSARDDSALSAEDAVKKFCYVFEGIDFAKSARFLIESQLGRGYREFCESLQLCSLCTDEHTPIDVIGMSRRDSLVGRLIERMPAIASSNLAKLFVFPDAELEYPIDKEIVSLARACGLLARGKVDLVGERIAEALNSKHRAIASNATVFALDAFATTGNLAGASALLSHEVAVNQTDPQFLPVAPIFSDSDWKDLRGVADSIDLSIALFLYAQVAGDRKTHTYRCFALETFLHENGCERPSELRSKLQDYSPEKLQFFLWRVCEPSVLDMLPALDSSRAVLEERRDICALLLHMHPGVPLYEQALLSISSELTIRQGLQTLDGSRVHVDLAALSAIVTRETAEDYQRYIALVRAGAVVSESLDTVIRELLKRDVNPKYLLAIPDSEADELLVAIFIQARNRFLFDPHHGLDSYLSKRIRHGSIVGYIRAPVEKEGIVTQKNPDGTYRANTIWRKHFETSHRRVELERAFTSFAKAIDQHLVRLKDVVLQVRTEQKPLGVFDVELTPQIYHLIRSAASGAPPIEAFAKSILVFLDAGLNPSLQNARQYLQRETWRFVSEQFDTLRASVVSIMNPTAERAELIAGINRASANTHAAIASVATWFDPITPEDVAYGMREIVDIAIASVKATSPTFDPILHFEDRTGFEFRNLLALLDVLFVVFGNIAEWSNKGGKPHVWFLAELNAERSVLTLSIENEVSLDRPFETCRSDIAERMERLRRGEGHEMVRQEGGSGFPKLASSALNLTPEALDCGYRSEDRFYLTIQLPAS